MKPQANTLPYQKPLNYGNWILLRVPTNITRTGLLFVVCSDNKLLSGLVMNECKASLKQLICSLFFSLSLTLINILSDSDSGQTVLLTSIIHKLFWFINDMLKDRDGNYKSGARISLVATKGYCGLTKITRVYN